MMKQIGTNLARHRLALTGAAALAVAAVLYAYVGATPAYACDDGGNYNFNENWNYNSNTNYNSNSNSNSSTSVTIRTSVSS